MSSLLNKSLPPLEESTVHTQVLIVGAGPVGLTLACELKRYGVAVRIVDKAPQRTDKSKALVLWSRTLELLDRGGGSEAFIKAGFKVAAVNFVATNGNPVGRVSMEAVKTPYPYALMLPQSESERLLEERLNHLGVEIERQVEVIRFVDAADGIEATLLHSDGHEENHEADWIAGCDGAHSTVRHTLGAAFEGETLTSDWLLADVHMKGYPFPDTEAAVYWHQDGAFVIFPISPGRYRILADLPASPSERPPTPTLEQAQAIITRRGPPGLVAFDPIWLAGFRINGRKVANYRHGRAFLLGDAAHVHSPAGGQGMNTGMQDAFNLAWKLALVIRKTCNEELLNSYSPERSAVGDEVLKSAARLTAVGTIKNHLAQRVRNVIGHLALGLAPVQDAFAETMTEVSVGYIHSPLNGSAVGAEPRPGRRLAPVEGQPPPGAGSTPRFALYADSRAASELIKGHSELLDPIVRPPIHPGGIWLIRPDGYVACSADAPAVISGYLDTLAVH
jgi:2-polyprenyl-6-methoxyphenol hydroxylase-like FAD-dependent oxidoreductase